MKKVMNSVIVKASYGINKIKNMTSSERVMKYVFDVNSDFKVEKQETVVNENGVVSTTLTVRPKGRKLKALCPKCGAPCKCYDGVTNPKMRTWRGLDAGASLAFIQTRVCRVYCPECKGVFTQAVPWAYHNSRFTKDFERAVAHEAMHTDMTAVSVKMRIDWETVGRCITRVWHDLEPQLEKRFDGLKHIGIDETSYRKGHKYITVVINHDTNTVVWAHEGHETEILKIFFRLLSEEQRKGILTVTGDGAQWIDNCVEEFIPDAIRGLDPFHVVQWANAALDSIRLRIWRQACADQEELDVIQKITIGRPRKDNALTAAVIAARAHTKSIKDWKYALGKNPNNLTKRQQLTLKFIQDSHPDVYQAYMLKEELRLLITSKDDESDDKSGATENNEPVPKKQESKKLTREEQQTLLREETEKKLKEWRTRAEKSGIPEMATFAAKIQRHEKHILNMIEYQMSNARVESINNKIKLIIRRAYGFRHVENLIALVMLNCSQIRVPLVNRLMEIDDQPPAP